MEVRVDLQAICTKTHCYRTPENIAVVTGITIDGPIHSSEPPKSKLGRLRQLAKHAGSRDSALQLGGMSIGD